MVSEKLRRYVNMDRVGRYIPLSPNVLTALSALVAWAGVPLVLFFGHPPWLYILLSGLLDGLDGAVARSKGVATRRGAFLDSFMDRYSDAAYLLYFLRQADPLALYLGLLGTFAISYARCRGESLGLEVRGVGFMERGERVAYLFLTAVAGEVAPQLQSPMLYLYIALVNIAAVYRMARIAAGLRGS
ncbi:CDP-alcohol phosphatidyltransferase family protein [Pyrobaculum neutrophilum]|uniref:CDP-alcohol phosphatidyltransferase n=1 Tax=Pyrobaculum neutrophilum (strain DSM 2338 / JCM 9278 / NBRC 100436 / V24Sta) TaxID=444157 RepID=B1Y960_PYRNV|nr:CDP-alcohol phosphatidyltransferase family protein [Pyrobaculum neutrophilum]ACB40289.1 CDP-alcohol phosphatidyltransferase [Pyrobaculum neutrophilum V24Sta]